MLRIAPRSGALQETSLPRWPLAKKPLCRFIPGFLEQKVQLAGGGIPIHLLVPAGLLACLEPLDEALVLFWRQAVDGSFDLLNPIHTWSLAPPVPDTDYGRGR